MTHRLLAIIALVLLLSVGVAYAADPVETELQEVEEQLRDGDADARIRASKWIRGQAEKFGDTFDTRALPLLEANLQHSYSEVRRWTILALATRGDSALPILEAALPGEADDKVLNQLNASIRHLKEAAEHAKWLAEHPCQKLDLDEVLEWEVRELCNSTGSYPPVVRDLGDGTSLYGDRHRANDECFRGKLKRPCRLKCMPLGTQIDTPDGLVSIEDLEVGDVVWTADADGKRAAVEVRETNSMPVTDHEVVEVTLADGRVVSASAAHPVTAGIYFGDLRAGQSLDGSNITSVRVVDYDGTHTFDILPDGPTGDYFADGVRIGSTLAVGRF